MQRRTALKNIAFSGLGIGLSSSLLSVMSGCSSAYDPGYAPQTFTPAQDELVATLVEQIIPTTETPGARAAGVHQYIDRVLALAKPEAETHTFVEGLAWLDAQAAAAGAQTFVALAPAAQTDILRQAEAAAQDSETPAFFTLLKHMTIYGYYTSEIGASQELRYVHAAGVYRGDMPYSEVGKNYF
ncbi:MAG: lactose 3-dehydrogenase subunit gamma LacC [Bacteroidia bacterium]